MKMGNRQKFQINYADDDDEVLDKRWDEEKKPGSVQGDDWVKRVSLISKKLKLMTLKRCKDANDNNEDEYCNEDDKSHFLPPFS